MNGRNQPNVERMERHAPATIFIACKQQSVSSCKPFTAEAYYDVGGYAVNQRASYETCQL